MTTTLDDIARDAKAARLQAVRRSVEAMDAADRADGWVEWLTEMGGAALEAADTGEL